MQRFDTVALTATRTAEGFIRDAPVIGRTGLMSYINADGTERIEYRPPEEAFAADSLASIQGKPITVGHKAMVNSGNAAIVQPIGTVLTAGRQDGDAIKADIVIYDLPTKARELSCGYSLDLDETPGTTPDGHHYDAIQRNIRYNHLAVVTRGRAGIARLNMDGDQEFGEEPHEGGTKNMEKIRLDSGIEYDAAPEVKVAYEKLKADAEKAKANMDALQAKYDAAQSDLEKAKKNAADAEKKHADELNKAVKERVALEAVAKAHKVENTDGMSNLDIKKAVIKDVYPEMNLDGKAEAYIEASYDIAKGVQKAHQDGMANQRKAAGTRKAENNDGEPDAYDLDAIMAKVRRDEAEAYLK